MPLQKGECERCKKYVGSGDIDYCAHCSKDLCPECMGKGCCGYIPADSGLQADDTPMSEEDYHEIVERHKRLHPGS